MANSVETDFIADVITAIETTSVNAARYGPEFEGKYPIACVALGNEGTEVPCFDLISREYILQVKVIDKSVEGCRTALQEIEKLFWDTSGAIYSHVQLCMPVNYVPPSVWLSDSKCIGGVEFRVIMRLDPS